MKRVADYKIHAQFTERWSPRSFEPRPMSEGDLMRLFEAARWAPSASNVQPWRFIYALRETPEFAATVDILVPPNRVWAVNASALILLCSVTEEGGRQILSHSFDAGAAWMSIAQQAYFLDMSSHAMGGFDRDKARAVFGLADNWEPQVVIAVGYRGNRSDLPEALQEREFPSPRRAVSESATKARIVPGAV